MLVGSWCLILISAALELDILKPLGQNAMHEVPSQCLFITFQILS